jgi:hypothetical protein
MQALKCLPAVAGAKYASDGNRLSLKVFISILALKGCDFKLNQSQ